MIGRFLGPLYPRRKSETGWMQSGEVVVMEDEFLARVLGKNTSRSASRIRALLNSRLNGTTCVVPDESCSRCMMM